MKEADGGFKKRLVHIKRPILRIPNLCIHLQVNLLLYLHSTREKTNRYRTVPACHRFVQERMNTSASLVVFTVGYLVYRSQTNVADPWSAVFLNPGSGMEKKIQKQDPGSGIRDEHPGTFFWERNLVPYQFFVVKNTVLIFFVANPGSCQPWIRDGKNWFRDKHPGFATLIPTLIFFLQTGSDFDLHFTIYCYGLANLLKNTRSSVYPLVFFSSALYVCQYSEHYFEMFLRKELVWSILEQKIVLFGLAPDTGMGYGKMKRISGFLALRLIWWFSIKINS